MRQQLSRRTVPIMLDANDLRPRTIINVDTVLCPVQGCQHQLPLQRRVFRRAREYCCPAHRIYVGRSTFEYQDPMEGLLWRSPEDLKLLKAIGSFKRESRFGRERSEDAVTWNVFRHLESGGRLAAVLSRILQRPVADPLLHYWSYDPSVRGTWEPLARARQAFDELPGRGSEPDLVISTADSDIWVEAKLGSSNDTTPSEPVASALRYSGGAQGWYESVVIAPFAAIAVEARRYELLRLWLLGSWVASQRGKRFVLLSLVREGSEEQVDAFAKAHLIQDSQRSLEQCTWESLWRGINADPPHTRADETLLNYMRLKTLGYDSAGRLRRAFAIDPSGASASGR